jgi:hypothetical protein
VRPLGTSSAGWGDHGGPSVSSLRSTSRRLPGMDVDKESSSSPTGSAERTKGPLLEAIQPLLDELKASTGPGRPRVLELASGLGEHIRVRPRRQRLLSISRLTTYVFIYDEQHLADANPDVTFQPTECDPHLVARVSQLCADVPNILSGLVLNVLSHDDWAGIRSQLAGSTFDGVFMQNILHIVRFTQHCSSELSPA